MENVAAQQEEVASGKKKRKKKKKAKSSAEESGAETVIHQEPPKFEVKKICNFPFDSGCHKAALEDLCCLVFLEG